MYNYLKLSSHHHSARHLPHGATSYPSLVFLILLAGVVLSGITVGSRADVPAGFDTPPAVHGSILFRTAVFGPPPRTKPTISTPQNNQHFGTPLITISGSCERGFLTRVSDNGIFTGAIFCSPAGTYQLQAQLFLGTNTLVVADFDNLDQSSPASDAVVVAYDGFSIEGISPVTPPSSSSTTGKVIPFYIYAQNPIKAYNPGDETTWELAFIGGTAPYALQINWGDGTIDLLSESSADAFTVKHIYKQSGTGPRSSYNIALKGTDVNNQTAYLQLTVQVNQRSGTIADTRPNSDGRLMIAWPLWVVALLMVAGFRIGELTVARKQLGQVSVGGHDG